MNAKKNLNGENYHSGYLAENIKAECYVG